MKNPEKTIIDRYRDNMFQKWLYRALEKYHQEFPSDFQKAIHGFCGNEQYMLPKLPISSSGTFTRDVSIDIGMEIRSEYGDEGTYYIIVD